jgi:hypothetical protein
MNELQTKQQEAASALQRVIELLEPLDNDQRAKVVRATVSFFDLSQDLES